MTIITICAAIILPLEIVTPMTKYPRYQKTYAFVLVETV